MDSLGEEKEKRERWGGEMERCTETQKDGMKGGRKESRGEKEKGEEEKEGRT